MKSESIMNKVFAVLFAAISILTLIGGFVGHPWHFWTSGLSAIISIILFTVKDNDKPSLT